MIHPNMATLLAFVTCDAAVSSNLWQQMLSRAADKSFNQITVDGDTSTNDSLIALSNGQSRTPAITEPGADADKLEAMLTEVCIYLAKSIARDGEGATCLLEIQVTGAADDAGARQIARTIAGSALFKSAVFGRDPNWGRIAAAAGRSGVPFEQDDLRVQLGDFLLMEHGQPLSFDRPAASAYMKAAAAGEYLKSDTVLVRVSVGSGSGTGIAWGCDLSYDYVKINAEYTT
jgi:glutamate N-acetyltransferase / amino-acid N-acetyltransferase